MISGAGAGPADYVRQGNINVTRESAGSTTAQAYYKLPNGRTIKVAVKYSANITDAQAQAGLESKVAMAVALALRTDIGGRTKKLTLVGSQMTREYSASGKTAKTMDVHEYMADTQARITKWSGRASEGAGAQDRLYMLMTAQRLFDGAASQHAQDARAAGGAPQTAAPTPALPLSDEDAMRYTFNIVGRAGGWVQHIRRQVGHVVPNSQEWGQAERYFAEKVPLAQRGEQLFTDIESVSSDGERIALLQFSQLIAHNELQQYQSIFADPDIQAGWGKIDPMIGARPTYSTADLQAAISTMQGWGQPPTDGKEYLAFLTQVYDTLQTPGQKQAFVWEVLLPAWNSVAAFELANPAQQG